MPDGVNGATVMSFVGASAPANPTAYKYEGSTSKTTVDVLFPESTAPGTQVWLTAFFFNERKQNARRARPSGPSSTTAARCRWRLNQRMKAEG
jgi:hypothetical protein